LSPARGEVRLGQAGPFRRVAFFAAQGSPTRTSLDDGGWGRSCAARLTPAQPPPRSSPGARSASSTARTSVPNQQPRPGPALSSQSVWGALAHPRRSLGTQLPSPPRNHGHPSPSPRSAPLSVRHLCHLQPPAPISPWPVAARPHPPLWQ
jgi:hypothetical protein